MATVPSQQMINIPCWRIEQRYSPAVLIGNWFEERLRYDKRNYDHNSTHRIDFRAYGTCKPDVIVRRNAATRNAGLKREHLINHHDGNKFSSNMVSGYDEFYNGRWIENEKTNKLRKWNGHKLQWIPEKSDYPLQHEPTNFGLLSSKQKKWEKQVAEQKLGDYFSIYSLSYTKNPREIISKDVFPDPRQPEPDNLNKLRCANPREESTKLHKYNLTNQNFNLRNVSAFKVPEKIENNLTDVSC